jgi:predicted Zn-dependent protease
MQARLFDKKSSAYESVEIEFSGNQLLVHTQDKGYAYPLDELTFSERLGNMPRFIYLNDEKVCECEDNATIDKELQQREIDPKSRFLHHLESKSPYIIPALFITISLVFVFISYLLPYASKKIAYTIPQNIALQIGTGTLETLDKLVLEPTKLDQDRQEQIRADFTKMVSGLQGLPPLHLEFRFSEKIGANAFALPDGSIILTDQLVILSHNNKELLAILAHEIGHIHNRHAIRMFLQNSAVFVVITTLTGDATAASSVLSALPTVLIESSFSRDLETEADDYAMELMKNRGLDLHYFADIMQRLSQGEIEDEKHEYLSSHPITSSRIEKFSQ